MNSKKVYFGLLGLLAILIISTAAVIVIGNNTIRDNSTKLVELKLEDKVLDKQETALIQANKDVEKYSELESIAKSIVPQDKDQAKSVREIVQIAQENGVKLSSITFPTSSLGTPEKKTEAKTSEQAASPDSQPSEENKQTTPTVSQVKPVDGIKGVYKLEIKIQSDEESPINYDNLISFLSALENNRRTAQVATIDIQPNSDNPKKLSFSITINVFIKP